MKRKTYIVTNDNVHHDTMDKAKQHVLDKTCSALYDEISKRDSEKSISYIEKRRFIDTLFGTYGDIIDLYELLEKILGPNYNIDDSIS